MPDYPIGALPTASPHCVLCSLPSMKDVIGYEEKTPETMAAIHAGYPRFVHHAFLHKVEEELIRLKGLKNKKLFLVQSEKVARAMAAFLGTDEAQIEDEQGWVSVSLPDEEVLVQPAKAFLQHTGGKLSSRQAEDWLVDQGHLKKAYTEKTIQENNASEESICQTMADVFGTVSLKDVHLVQSGMNAFYAAFNAINRVQADKGKKRWLCIGWVYVDTTQILQKLSPPEVPPIVLYDVFDWEQIEAAIVTHADSLAGIVSEFPTNPLIQACDLERLYALARRYDIALVVDPTVATPFNVSVLPHADIVVNSLTKYAANEADVMAGITVLNPQSPYYSALSEAIIEYEQPLYWRDAARLAWEIQGYSSTLETMNATTMGLVNALESHPKVRKVFWAYEEQSSAFYQNLAGKDNAPGCMISILLDKPLASFYDRCQLMKGTSFGVYFTLLCPFMYLAHYEELRSRKGLLKIRNAGLDPELIRISVGTEDLEALKAIFYDALDG